MNSNHRWDPPEPFEDLNANHHWDSSYIEYINKDQMSMMELVQNTVSRDNNSLNITDKDVVMMIKESTGKYNDKYISKIPSKYIQDNFINRGNLAVNRSRK